MTREKMADPAFQKVISETIHKENKIRRKWHLDVICGLPHTSKVDWDEDCVSDNESENVTECSKRKSHESHEEHSRGHDEKNSSKEQTTASKASPSVLGTSKEEAFIEKLKKHKDLERNVRYIFPVCDYCDFGWRFDSNKYVFCPRHGPRRM